MTYYIGLLVWLLFCLVAFKKQNKFQLFLTLLPVFILVGLRDASVGEDTSRYVAIYEGMDASNLSIAISESPYEAGFVVLSWFLKILDLGPQWLLITESFIFCLSIFLLCNHNAKDKIFVAVAVILTLFEFSLTGVRQTIAISLLLIVYRFVVERNLKLYILFMFLAVSCHTSAILIAPVYYLANRGFDKNTVIIYVLMLAVSLLSIDYLFAVISSTLNYEEYYLMSLNGGVFTFLASFGFVYVALKHYKTDRDNIQFTSGAHHSMLLAFFSAIRFVNVMISRVIYYISPIPYLMIDSLNEKNKSKKTYKKIALLYVFVLFIYRLKYFYPYFFGHV